MLLCKTGQERAKLCMGWLEFSLCPACPENGLRTKSSSTTDKRSVYFQPPDKGRVARNAARSLEAEVDP